MSSTVFVTIPVNTWTLVLAASKTALMSNEGGNAVRWVEATTLPVYPTANNGHLLNNGAGVTRATPVGQEIYAYATSNASIIAVTES